MGYTLGSPYDELYSAYLAYVQPRVSAQGYAKLADRARRVLHWFEIEEIDPELIVIQDAVRYQAHLSTLTTKSGEPLATGTMVNYLKTARGVFGYLLETEVIGTNPFVELSYPGAGNHLTRNVLSETQMHLLLSKLTRFDEVPSALERVRRYRVHVLAEFLYASGLRIAEAASLVPANIDSEHRLVYVPEGKGGSARTAFLSGYAAEVLRRYLDRGRAAVLGYYPRERVDTVFGASKARLAEVVNDELRAVCAELEIPVITTHGFRHSLGTHLLRAGCDMRHIQAILGHRSIGSTQVYTRVDKDDLKRSIDAYHPRKWQRGVSRAESTV